MKKGQKRVTKGDHNWKMLWNHLKITSGGVRQSLRVLSQGTSGAFARGVGGTSGVFGRVLRAKRCQNESPKGIILRFAEIPKIMLPLVQELNFEGQRG